MITHTVENAGNLRRFLKKEEDFNLFFSAPNKIFKMSEDIKNLESNPLD